MVGTIDHLTSNLADNAELYEMSKDEGDEDGLRAIEAEAASAARRRWRSSSSAACSTTRPTRCNCFIDIQAGAGGTEACDWASMLLRQYLKYCERKGFKATVEDETAGRHRRHQERHHQGRGRLRLRPCCAPRPACTAWCARARSTPRAGATPASRQLFVYPEVDDSIEIDINPADVRTDTFRASGAGGQHINKTDSAVRLTHIPTGIVVQCQDGRSQHSNRDVAWKRLRSRLYDHEMRKRQEEQQKLEDTKTDVGWGHQIRSYVLDQSRIKDLRTNVEISNTQKVLDGDLDAFIEASLKQGL